MTFKNAIKTIFVVFILAIGIIHLKISMQNLYYPSKIAHLEKIAKENSMWLTNTKDTANNIKINLFYNGQLCHIPDHIALNVLRFFLAEKKLWHKIKTKRKFNIFMMIKVNKLQLKVYFNKKDLTNLHLLKNLIVYCTLKQQK